MANKITDKLISIPPYISTSWSRISALHMKGSVLVITLIDGEVVNVPNIDSETIHLIFHYHTLYLEKEETLPALGLDISKLNASKLKEIFEQEEQPSIRFAFGSSLENLGNIMQHNPTQADAPDLPKEILHKISAIAKIIGSSEELALPKAEPSCNCFHCQIARAMNPAASADHQQVHESEVQEEELQFQQWNITQTGDKLFCVVNRLDEHEKYNVFLGQPIGCTCGKEGCPHIIAVLKS